MEETLYKRIMTREGYAYEPIELNDREKEIANIAQEKLIDIILMDIIVIRQSSNDWQKFHDKILIYLQSLKNSFNNTS